MHARTHLPIAILVEKFKRFVDLLGEVSLHFPHLHHGDELVEGDTPAFVGVNLQRCTYACMTSRPTQVRKG